MKHININRKPAGIIRVVRTQDYITFINDSTSDVIAVCESNAQHTNETEEEYLKRLFSDKPYVIGWIKNWKEQGLY
mgnify:FL=1